MGSELKRHLYLTGYRGTGKTSVARILSPALSLPLVDLDDRIEVAAGLTIREIFAAGGETRFRDLEADAVALVAAEPASVVSLGGGAVLRESNRAVIAESGWSVWLDASAETLAQRVSGDSTTGDRRPSLTGLPSADEIRLLLEQRRPIYAQVADLQIDTERKPVDEIADEIVRWYRSRSVSAK